ncbi:hypothetical protein [Arthrobacter sp. Marseille-P9274]|uniref:hypothetical protein n=1 Tax=Arthrobacter sp. Marseille-P9274 TaxID=2866572 RepID=UPI0021C73476|nr:hypothetical protein [Arthrobacter sp. Marseille-P9274]
MNIPEDGGRLEDDPEFAAMLEEFGFFLAPEGYEDEDDYPEPNPLWVENGVLPPDAREHLLSNEDGRVIIDYPPDDQPGLDVLAPVFDVVRSVQTTYGVTDFSLLDEIPHLEALSIDDKIKTAPTRREWPQLRRYDGPWQPEAAPFVAAPRLDSLRLLGATQEALDLIQGPLSSLFLQRLKVADGSPGWPHPAEIVSIDTTRRVDVSRIHQLASAEKIRFDGIGEVSGLDVVSAEHPLRELHLENVRSLGTTVNPWLIQADRTYVMGRPNVMKWVNEALLHRPDDWDQRWVLDHGWVP